MIVHFSAHISKWELVCKFGVIFHIFIISCLCSRFHVRNQWFFYSVITFSYIKCFVHSYTVDVVFTLSYYMKLQTHLLHRYSIFYNSMINKNAPANRNNIQKPLCIQSPKTPPHQPHPHQVFVFKTDNFLCSHWQKCCLIPAWLRNYALYKVW